jgi:hypothetical protein
MSVRRFWVDVDQSKVAGRSYPSDDWPQRMESNYRCILFRTAPPRCYENVLALRDQEVLYRALGVQRLLNLDDAIRLLRSEVDRAGSQRAFARKAGVNVSVVSKTLRGIVLPSEKILRALKLRIVYLSK